MQTHAAAQSVQHESLLRFRESNLGRHTGVAHGRGGRGSRATFGTGDDDDVCLGFGDACGNGSHAAFGNEFHADFRSRVEVLEVEDELREVFNGVDVVVRRRRNQ